MYGLCVVEMTLCRAFNACTVFSCFLHPSGGGAYTQEVYHSGMAQGVDMYAAEIVLELKKQDPQITLECAIPYERQAVRWPEALRNRYFSIAERNAADGLVCTEPPETGMAGISGYLGTLYLISHIKRSLSAMAEGLLLF